MTSSRVLYDDQGEEIPDFYPAESGEDAGGVPKLDTLETSADVPTSSGYRAFLISGMPNQVAKADRLYERLDKIKPAHRLFNFRCCHTVAAFLRHKETGHIRIGSNSCKLRWCPLCARTKKSIIAANTTDWLKEKKKPKFITLTLAHTDTPLSDQIDRLYNSFRKLREKPIWKKKIRGGIWFFQIKKAEDGIHWHPHLHIVSHGDFIDKFELSAIWKGITNDSKIVDVRKIEKTSTAAKYVARYASMPVDLDKTSDEDLLSVAVALSGRRIVGTFGSARKLQLSIKPPADKESWQHLRSFNDVYDCKDFDPVAAEIWRCYKNRQPCNILPPDPPPVSIAIDMEAEIKKAEEQLLLFGQK